MLYEYSRENNISMKAMYEKLWEDINAEGKMSNWNVTKISNDFLDERIATYDKEQDFQVNITDDKEWPYLNGFIRFYNMIMRKRSEGDAFDWSSNNIGTLLIKTFTNFENYNLVEKEMLHSIFTIPGEKYPYWILHSFTL